MSSKQRAVIMRLDRGYLGTDARSTNDRSRAVQFIPEDAHRFIAALKPRPRRYEDPLFGMSLELLPKRGTHHPLDATAFRVFLTNIKTTRILAEADRFDRLAAGYVAQAREAERMAASMRAKAADLRVAVKVA